HHQPPTLLTSNTPSLSEIYTLSLHDALTISENFSAVNDRPMSQGTRMHQLAMYVIYESPLQMLADSPTHYLKEKQEIRDYLSEVDRKSTRLNSSHVSISYAVFCLKKKQNRIH